MWIIKIDIYQSRSFGLWACIWEWWSPENEWLQRQQKNICDFWSKASKPPNYTRQERLQERSWLSLTASSPIETEHSLKRSSSSPWYQLYTNKNKIERKRARLGWENKQEHKISMFLCSVLALCFVWRLKRVWAFRRAIGHAIGRVRCGVYIVGNERTNGEETRWIIIIKDNVFWFPELLFPLFCGCSICKGILGFYLVFIFSLINLVLARVRKNYCINYS